MTVCRLVVRLVDLMFDWSAGRLVGRSVCHNFLIRSRGSTSNAPIRAFVLGGLINHSDLYIISREKLTALAVNSQISASVNLLISASVNLYSKSRFGAWNKF